MDAVFSKVFSSFLIESVNANEAFWSVLRMSYSVWLKASMAFSGRMSISRPFFSE